MKKSTSCTISDAVSQFNSAINSYSQESQRFLPLSLSLSLWIFGSDPKQLTTPLQLLLFTNSHSDPSSLSLLRRRFDFSDGDGAVNVRRQRPPLLPDEIRGAAVSAGGGGGDVVGAVVPAKRRRRGRSDFWRVAEGNDRLGVSSRRRRHKPYAALLHHSVSVQTGTSRSLSSWFRFCWFLKWKFCDRKHWSQSYEQKARFVN